MIEKQKHRILVVDDDKPLADNLTECLNRLGYQASVAYGGQEAIEVFEKGDFNLVISDLMMPEMDGIDLLKRIRDLGSRAVFLVITSNVRLSFCM